MTMNRRSFLATTAAATAAIGTPMILRAQPKEYVLGASLPLTGPFATAGQLVAPAFAMATKLFNDEGGVAGVPIRFVTEDSGYVPQNALNNYQRALASEGKNMIGYFADSTGAMKLIAPELKGENARIMGSTSFASELANPETHPYQYLSGPTPEPVRHSAAEHQERGRAEGGLHLLQHRVRARSDRTRPQDRRGAWP
ncbi:ABC transporter substrate-binding protein [Sulfitobacter sp. 1A12157]|uniref:ABC transporter substrate-binding protein n=1 Tax=Sulfitobacter sp. 1A12157 TaxID=3368594 RepID=UPI003745FA16